MAERTSIEWAHHTFNPWRGCSKAHLGCLNCYAEALGHRFGEGWGEVWQGAPRVIASDSHMREPYRWARKAAAVGERHRVFLASRADVLEEIAEPERWPASWDDVRIASMRSHVVDTRAAVERRRAEVWDTIWGTAEAGHDHGCSEGPRGGLDYLLLTKRPENAAMVPAHIRPHVWLGTSVSDQPTADEWVPRLLAAEGFRLRFLSVEPLVGPVNLRGLLMEGAEPARCVCGHGHGFSRCPNTGGVGARCHHRACPCPGFRRAVDPRTGIHWVIVGGESGPKARPCNVGWIRDVVRQCRDAGVACFVKQIGKRPVEVEGGGVTVSMRLAAKKGGNLEEWPEDIRIREFPPEVSP